MGAFFRRKNSAVAAETRSLYVRGPGDMTTQAVNGAAPGVFYLGSDILSGLLAGNGTAEALPAVTRATSLICSPLTEAPFRLVNDATGAALPTPRWIGDPQLLRPDNRLGFSSDGGMQALPAAYRLTRSRFWAELLRNAAWLGEGFFMFQEDSYGSPLAGTMRLVDPRAVDVTPDGRWALGMAGAEQAVFDRDGRISLGPVTYRIVCLRNPLSPVDEYGRTKGVFELHKDSFDSVLKVNNYIAGTFSAGVPSGYLKIAHSGLGQDDADDLREDWMSRHGSDSRSIAVLGAGVEFVPISISPIDAEATQIKRVSVAEIAFAFGLPPEVLSTSGFSNSSTYANRQDEWSRMKATGLAPWISELEDVLTALVPYGTSVQVDFSESEVALSTAEEPKSAPAPRALESLAPVSEEPSEEAA